MQPYLSKKDEKMLYWILAGCFAVLVVLYVLWQTCDWTIHLPMCAMLRYTGLYCPGCGGTRAFASLMKGQWMAAVYFHPIVPYGAAIGSWYLISHTLEYISKGKWEIGMRYRDIYIYLAVALIFLNWMVKNMILLIWGIRLI